MKYVFMLLVSITAHADLKSDYQAFHKCDVESKEMWKKDNACWQGDPAKIGECVQSNKPDCTKVREVYEKHDQYERYLFEQKQSEIK